MFDLSAKTSVLYALIIVIGGCFLYLRVAMYLRAPTVPAKPSNPYPIPISTRVAIDPVVEDLMADLFTSYLTGRVIGLINTDSNELRYYRQLFEIVQSRFIDNPGFNEEDAKMDLSDFKFAIIDSLSKVPSVRVRQTIHTRLDKIIEAIKSTGYYQGEGIVDVTDIHRAFQGAIRIVDYHNVTIGADG